jgi:hypothetical protein
VADFVGLALMRAEEELPHWGRSTLEFRDASNPSAKTFFALGDKDEVHHLPRGTPKAHDAVPTCGFRHPGVGYVGGL